MRRETNLTKQVTDARFVSALHELTKLEPEPHFSLLPSGGCFFIDFCCFSENSDCLFVSGLRIKTAPALVVFTAKGVALSVCEPACATRNKPYKASDRHAVCECIARTYQARAGASFFFTHRLVGVFLLISAVFLRTAIACSYQA